MLLKFRTENQSVHHARYKKQVNVSISPELYEEFKKKCANYGVSMTMVIIHTMLEFTDQPDVNEVKKILQIGGQ